MRTARDNVLRGVDVFLGLVEISALPVRANEGEEWFEARLMTMCFGQRRRPLEAGGGVIQLPAPQMNQPNAVERLDDAERVATGDVDFK